MRILQVIPFFSPKMGGSAQVVFQISSQLARRGHSVTVASSDFAVNEASFPAGSFQIKLFRNLLAQWGFYLNPSFYFWLKKHISEFEVIHLHEYRTFQNIVARNLAVKNRVPYVLSAHGTAPVIVQRQLVKSIYDRLFGKKILEGASRFIAVSPLETEQYQQLGVEASRIQLIFNGIDLAEFKSLPPAGQFRKKYGIPAETKIGLYMGRLHKRKGINFLIEALADVRKLHNDQVLVLSGPDDGEQGNLEGLVQERRLHRYVKLVGPLYGADKLSAYVDANVLVLPAQYEIFGLVLFEALMCGTPIITTDDCGMSPMIQNHQMGWTVPYGDTAAIGEALSESFSEECRAAEMVARGQEFVRQQLDWNAVILQYERLYQQVSGPSYVQ